MESDQPLEPPAKRRKLLALSEVPQILQHQRQHEGAKLKEEESVYDPKCLQQYHKTELGSKCPSGDTCKEVHDEEEDEATQIESSLPLYLKYMFGPFIGHSQLGENTTHQSTGREKEIAKQHVSLLESQGFLYSLPLSQKSSSPHPKEIETSECPQSPLLFMSPISPCKNHNSLQTEERRSSAVSSTALLERSISTSGSSTSKVPLTTCSISPSCGIKRAMSVSDFTMNVKTEAKVKLQGEVERAKEEGSEQCSTEKLPVRSDRNRKRPLSHLSSGGYAPPPLCTCLANCTESGKNVSLFVIVLQGLFFFACTFYSYRYTVEL